MLTTVAQRPNLPATCGDQLGRLDGGRVDADLLGPGLDQPRGVFQRADAAADGERHEDLLGHAAHHVEHDVPALVAGADVEEDQLVGPVLPRSGGRPRPGSPASRRLRKLTPLTTRPRSTSRQGMMRLVSMLRPAPAAAALKANPLHFTHYQEDGQSPRRRRDGALAPKAGGVKRRLHKIACRLSTGAKWLRESWKCQDSGGVSV